MKKLFSCIAFLLLHVVSVFSQNTISLVGVDSSVSKDANCFECFYNVYSDSLFLGTVYAMTCYSQEENDITLCLTDDSEIPEYVLYKFPLSDDAIIIIDDYEMSVCDTSLVYEVSYDNEYFHIMLNFTLDGKCFIYTGKVEVFDDPD